MKTGDALTQEALALRARYDEEPSHSDHVTALALQIFDGLRAWHGLASRSRELLCCASLLHDIGWSQIPDGKGHHKWSARLIHAHPWKHLSPAEVVVVAQIARYHRKSPPQSDHADFHALKPSAQKHVMVLGGILRIADALDRTHTTRIARVKASVKAEAIVVRVETAGLWDAERTMFATKSDMLQEAGRRRVLVEAKRVSG
ncbi:MAG TPA: HD domain-containing protein [Candidatus Methylacidiphilales bacterium]|jgi:exopolyphosphatase/guanosine-5'-triphosphate,3'-diphosphate pyrophosphatase|nr:HD domain-containing protein [Candidatus Methylacidiphilales bacterium]